MTDLDVPICAVCDQPVHADDACFTGPDCYHPACCPECNNHEETTE